MTILNRHILGVAVILTFYSTLFAWGKEGHAIINGHAAKLMPPPVRTFFLHYRDSLAILGAEPDNWRKSKPELRNWHFIDLDLLDTPPFESIPVDRAKAEAKFGKKKIKKAGICPWAVEHHYRNLVRHYKKKRWAFLRKDLIGLSHYLGDAHQPLHTTVNYNGQKTGNKDVHFRFESDLIEKYNEKYFSLPRTSLIRPSKKIEALNQRTFSIARSAYHHIKLVNDADIACRKKSLDYGKKYFLCYESMVGSILRKQLAEAASNVAAYWYSAWLEAGKPELSTEE